VGTIQSPMDAFQLMRLRADAVREATGADVGWIGAATPGWATWRTTLPAGPVTPHDLATLHMLPEYVVVGEVSGETLLQLIDRSPFHTVLDDRRDPAYEAKTSLLRADVDPQKTYRIATGYHGRPAYGAEPKKMPPLLLFRSPEEFVASGNTSLPIRNVRQLPLEVTEAVGRYIRARGTVSPRAVCFDLDAYILDPRANHFGACDWLHLGLRGDWQNLDGGRSCPFRYVLSVGLRRGDDPERAPPRDKSKQFVELDLDNQARPAAFRFETLGKRLTVDATIDVEHLSIVAGKGVKPFALADAGASEAVGRMALLRLRLNNHSADELTALAALSTEALNSAQPGGRSRVWIIDRTVLPGGSSTCRSLSTSTSPSARRETRSFPLTDPLELGAAGPASLTITTRASTVSPRCGIAGRTIFSTTTSRWTAASRAT